MQHWRIDRRTALAGLGAASMPGIGALSFAQPPGFRPRTPSTAEAIAPDDPADPSMLRCRDPHGFGIALKPV